MSTMYFVAISCESPTPCSVTYPAEPEAYKTWGIATRSVEAVRKEAGRAGWAIRSGRYGHDLCPNHLGVNLEFDTSGLRWLHVLTGEVAHAFRPGIDRVTCCGIAANALRWVGDGADVEKAAAARLRRCQRCLDALSRHPTL
jgi:hypothetical protein